MYTIGKKVKKIVRESTLFILGNIIGIVLGVLASYFVPSTESPIVIETIRDSIIRDSIYIENDGIKTQIIYLDKKHDKETSNIMSNSDSANLDLFSEYIRNYQRTVKNN